MYIENYVLHVGADSYELPHLPYDTYVRVWEVPENYRESGLFITADTAEIPACEHSEPVFEQFLPAHEGAVLAEVKAKKNAQINEWRLAANQSTFTYLGKTFACDALSRSDIEGVANTANLTGSFPEGFPNAWKAIDNTYIPILTVKEFGAFYKAMADRGSVNFAHSQQLKTMLSNAMTIEEVDAIAW